MSNQYFDWPAKAAADRFVRFDTVRAEDANDALDLASAGFEKLPTPVQVWGDSQNYASAAGLVDAWSATVAATYLTAYTDGMQVRVKFPAANTSAVPTLNVNGLGARIIVNSNGGALVAGDIAAGLVSTMTYVAAISRWQLVSTALSASAAAGYAAAAAASEAAAAAAVSAAQFVDYAALRAYTGSSKTQYVTGYTAAGASLGINGLFVTDDADTTSADNGGTIIVSANGKRRKRHSMIGWICLEWFEGADFTGAVASDAALVNFFNACRTTGLGAKSGPGTILVTQSHDASDIEFIDMFMTRMQGNLGATHMISIGASTGVLTESNFKLKVANIGSSSTAGNKGIRLLGIRSSDCTFFMEGFNVGCYYDGTTGLPSNLLDNRFWNSRSYNCGTGFQFDLSGTAYVNANQWFGGGFYLGTNVKVAGRAPFKVTTTGASAQFADNVAWNTEISLDANSWHAASATHLYVENNNTAIQHSMFFRDCRFELNAGPPADDLIPFHVAVNPNSASRFHCEIDQTSTNALRWMPVLGDQKNNSCIIRNNNLWSSLNNQVHQRITLPEVFPYQTSDGIYVPDRVIFDASFTAPVQIITGGVAALTTRANGDGKLYCQTPTVTYGRVYSRTVGHTVELELPVTTTWLVICYDATGAVIGGTAPWYIQGVGVRSATVAGAACYEANSKHVFIHPDVASFYLGACSWTSGARELPDLNSDIRVLVGENLVTVCTHHTTPNEISATAAINTYCRAGRIFDGPAGQRWRCSFDLATTGTNARVNPDTTIDLTSVAGVASGDRIGIELDQIVATGQQQVHWTTVNGAPAGSTVTLTDAIPVGKTVAIGRRVVVNRWAAFFLTGSATYDAASLADGAGATTTVTVTGAALGDFAEASFSVDIQGMTVTTWVSAANTVSVRLQNETGAAVDLASATIRCSVKKPS